MAGQMDKRDGHTHTHFCYHGSGDHAELYVQNAIAQGFRTYSITEHPPLPEALTSRIPNGQALIDELAMPMKRLGEYLDMAESLREQYKDSIRLMAGLEVDYIPGMEQWTKGMLDECAGRLEDSLLSVHYLPGKGGWRCVDYTAEDFKEGLVDYYGSAERVYEAYYEAVEQSIDADLGLYKPKRVGHLTLIHKFKDAAAPADPDCCNDAILRILDKVQAKGMELDVNLAGLYQPACREVYPPEWILREAVKRGIPLVYGSDSHNPGHVGRGYDVYEQLMHKLHGERA
ncbi:histidinol-phosphatase HisJ [Paenibacillus protaetiae]|uniref:Histidinol-phosphatase n=1 Tax=Paenibacillus protaetiae TaxID=2509456 RepID=A0A4P6EW74_9BACL|nr:histidinol-phosphatase HisJ [Paenibacillus protaetiae]QAY66936.1 histidinol-phosphatase HisJ [Paenibacillus protaetiae]